jgi:uncharacterized membrane protein
MESIKSLYDFKFDTLIASKIIRTLYAVLAILVTGIMGIFTLVLIPGSRGLSLIFMPIVTVIYLVILRVSIESVIVKFQMAQDIRDIKNKYLAS